MVGAYQRVDGFLAAFTFLFPHVDIFGGVVLVAKRSRTKRALFRRRLRAIVAKMSGAQPFADGQRFPREAFQMISFGTTDLIAEHQLAAFQATITPIVRYFERL